jgi:large subunit ribosomal protein L23
MAKKSEKKVSTARVGDYAKLLRPIITEKSAVVGAAGNTFVFEVDPRATKTDVREAIERIFSVNVRAVRTANCLGKVKRTARSIGRQIGVKKAYVTLAEGQKIDVVEGL